MRRWLPTLLLLSACGGGPTVAPAPSTEPSADATSSATAEASPVPTQEVTPTPAPQRTPRADPRWRFFTSDRVRHSSPWYAGRHLVMIDYGCTRAPYYDPDPGCPGDQGFHHGVDVAMPCGTPLTAAVDGVVLDPAQSGSPGPAYGERPFRIRAGTSTGPRTVDVLIGHARTVLVEPGERVRRGQRIALASDSAAPDGCHLHFEVRRAGGGVRDAVDPYPLLALS